jgi:membrane-bound lytic murein transglycosylase D
MYRMIGVGMILFLTSACLPGIHSLSPKNDFDARSKNVAEHSLFTQSEIEKLLPDQPALYHNDPSVSVPLPVSVTQNQIGIRNLNLPISDESSDDFNLKILSGDSSGRKKEFDIPIVINEKVEHFIRYFQTTIRSHFSNWLARSEKYIPFMREVLKERGLPEDLVYLAMIESGFNPYAYSRAKAMGVWQFISPTGKRYGLKSNWWVDERRDPEKSTIAAAGYLKDLYDMFECWYLAAAGYNAGENKIANGMKRYRTEDFWELTKYRYLKQETKHYVPQMIAAALIAKDPEKYGFIGIEYQEPLQYDKVMVPPAVDLRLIAKACEITVDELKDLNPELRRWCTPPDVSEYEIKIPFGKSDIFRKNFESLRSERSGSFKIHIVKKGETPQQIARLYRVELEPILELNSLGKKSRLSIGANLLIPIPKEIETKPGSLAAKRSGEKTNPSTSQEIIYVVRTGDSLYKIANQYNVSISEIKAWNNLNGNDRIYPSDKLKLKLAGPKS